MENGNISHVSQLESIHPEKPHVRAHLDFTFTNRNEIGVLECKSVSFIPNEPYDGWEKQIYYQMGLLALNHRKKKIKGAVIALDLQTGDVRIFNGYKHNPLIFRELEASADRIWQSLQNKDIQNLKTNKSALCSYCQYRENCPAFFVDGSTVVDLSPIQKDVDRYMDAKLLEREGKSLSFQAKARIQRFLGQFRTGRAEKPLSRYPKGKRKPLIPRRSNRPIRICSKNSKKPHHTPSSRFHRTTSCNWKVPSAGCFYRIPFPFIPSR